MTNKVQAEDTPNPYNANKEWHTEDKPFVSSESLYFEEPQINYLIAMTSLKSKLKEV